MGSPFARLSRALQALAGLAGASLDAAVGKGEFSSLGGNPMTRNLEFAGNGQGKLCAVFEGGSNNARNGQEKPCAVLKGGSNNAARTTEP